jgi:hypothetical protein
MCICTLTCSMDIPLFIVLTLIILYRYRVFYKLKVHGNSLLNKSISTISPKVQIITIFNNETFSNQFFRHNATIYLIDLSIV